MTLRMVITLDITPMAKSIKNDKLYTIKIKMSPVSSVKDKVKKMRIQATKREKIVAKYIR